MKWRVRLQVGNTLEQRQQWNRPEDVVTAQLHGEVLLDDSPSDLAGQVAAALTAGALALNQYRRLDTSTAFVFVRAPFHPPLRALVERVPHALRSARVYVLSRFR